MKTTEEKAEKYEDIIFKGRNKEYGAYNLRKRYSIFVNRAMAITIGLLLTAVAIPLIAGYYGKTVVKCKILTSGFDPMGKFTVDPPPPPPPPPPPILDDAIDKKATFVAPKPTSEEVPDYTLNIDELLAHTTNTKIADTSGTGGRLPEPPPVINSVEKAQLYLSVSEMPEFVGGEAARMKFLADNIVYPMEARELGITGTVYLQFEIGVTGKVTNISILRGIGGNCEEEATRVLSIMPNWTPGKQNNIPVRVRLTMPIKFTLDK